MKNGIVFIFVIMLLLIGCDTTQSPITNEYVSFNVLSGAPKYVKEAKIYNTLYIIQDGLLPMNITAEVNDSITALFEVNASNFASNHLECDCISIGADQYRCTQGHIVNGDDWYIAAGDTVEHCM